MPLAILNPLSACATATRETGHTASDNPKTTVGAETGAATDETITAAGAGGTAGRNRVAAAGVRGRPAPLRRAEERGCRLGSLIGLALLLCAPARAAAPAVGAGKPDAPVFREDFESDAGRRWAERDFPSVARKNRFFVARDDDGNHYLRAESTRSSSARGVRFALSIERCPYLSWRWRVSNTIASADLRFRERDDAAAKLYLVFDGPSRWNPLDKRIFVYVWDHAGPAGRILPNAWLPDKEKMLVLESAASPTAQWLDEAVDLERDFERAFPGERPGELEALAFIADTDNTNSHVLADLDDVQLRCRPAP